MMLPQLHNFQNRSILQRLVWVTLFLACFQTATAQLVIDPEFSLTDTSQIHTLHTQQGDFLNGRVIGIQDSVITFRFQQNTLNFNFDEIRRIEVYYPGQTSGASQGSPTLSEFVPMWGHENLLFSSTAFGLPKGRNEYRNVMIAGNFLESGLTDNITLGLGSILPVIISGKVKLSFPIAPKARLGIGSQIFINTISGNSNLSTLYGNFTIGSPDAFVNIQAGQYFVLDYYGESEFFMTAGGAWRIGNRWRIMTDIFIIPRYFGDGAFVPTGGAGWFAPRHRIDFGLSIFGDFTDAIFPIPYAAYAFRFGKS